MRITRGAFWPQLSLFGNASAQNALFGTPQDADISGVPQSGFVGSFTVGAKVDWQIFDSLSTYTTLRQDILTSERLAEDRNRVLSVVRSEVASAYGRMSAAVARRQILADAARVAETAVDLIRRRYEAGTALLLEVLQAQADLQQVEISVVNNAIDIATLRVALDGARGRL